MPYCYLLLFGTILYSLKCAHPQKQADMYTKAFHTFPLKYLQSVLILFLFFSLFSHTKTGTHKLASAQT